MFTPFSRLLLLLLCVALSLLGAYLSLWPLLVFSTLCSIALLWGYYKIGTVPLALIKTRKNEFDKAEKILDLIQNPDRLNKKYKAYYYFIRGFIARERDQFEESKTCLDEVLAIGMKTETDRAMTLLALADMELLHQKEDSARVYFMQLKNLKVNASLMPSIRKMQEFLKV
jgi:hypothetical protein